MNGVLTISDNVKAVRERMNSASADSGLGTRELTLVAATKTMNPDAIRQAVDAGTDAVGENRVQEFSEKLALNAYEGVQTHFIGRLQKNKAKKLVGVVDLIQSVDSLELLRLIDRLAGNLGIVQEVLLQVNLDFEQSKGGISADALLELCQTASPMTSVKVRGLMAIPPAGLDSAAGRSYFSRMYKLFVDIHTQKYDNVSMDYLSMGMSGDFEDALREGSNMVRVGTAIFGGR